MVTNAFEEDEILLLAPEATLKRADGGDPLLLELFGGPKDIAVAVRSRVENLGNFVPAWTLVVVVNLPGLMLSLRKNLP